MPKYLGLFSVKLLNIILLLNLSTQISMGANMSKLILWVGFLLSIPLLIFVLFFSTSAKMFPLILWSVIFVGSGYKLFFSQPKK